MDLLLLNAQPEGMFCARKSPPPIKADVKEPKRKMAKHHYPTHKIMQ
jgi:hypothetical protein